MVGIQCKYCGIWFEEEEPGIRVCKSCWKTGNLMKTCSVCGIEYEAFFFLKGKPICIPCEERRQELQDAVES